LLSTLVLLATACTQPAPAGQGSAKPPAASEKKPSIKVAYGSGYGFTDLPSLIAQERLRTAGYEVTDVTLNGPELAIEAIAKGEAQLGGGASFPQLQAMQKGAEIKIIADRGANEWVVVSTPDLRQCADLSNKRVGVHSAGSVSTAMLKAWLASTCPQATPQILIIAGSDNRAAALIAGQLDASPLELADAINLDAKAAGKFHRLTDFSTGLPDLDTGTRLANSEFLKSNRPAVVDFTRELIRTNREINSNPNILKEATQRYIPELMPNVDAVIAGYQAIKAFDPNGGLTRRRMEYTIDFFVKAGSLEEGLTADQVADYSIIEDALKELGRQ
jgi:NitT/TauT family transport system substrate-binding protein